MGNNNTSIEGSVMKKSPSTPGNNQNSGHNIQLHGSAPLDPEAPPNYDDIFGPGHRAGSASQSPHTSSSSSAATSPRSAPPIPSPSSSFAIPPPSQAAWGTAVPGAPSQHPQYTNPAPNWRQQEEEAELRMWFSAVDENNDGSITTEELRQALLNDNWTPFNMDTIKMMCRLFDKNANDRIEFDEFAGLKRYVQDWKKTFDQYDVDHSGTIDIEEIQKAFHGMNYSLSVAFCGQLCHRFSTSGQMNLDAFIYACAMVISMSKDHARTRNTGTLEEFLRAWLNQPSR